VPASVRRANTGLYQRLREMLSSLFLGLGLIAVTFARGMYGLLQYYASFTL